jgi:hypothetical protein
MPDVVREFVKALVEAWEDETPMEEMMDLLASYMEVPERRAALREFATGPLLSEDLARPGPPERHALPAHRPPRNP